MEQITRQPSHSCHGQTCKYFCGPIINQLEKLECAKAAQTIVESANIVIYTILTCSCVHLILASRLCSKPLIDEGFGNKSLALNIVIFKHYFQVKSGPHNMAAAAHFLNAVSAHFHHYYSDSNDETEIKYEIKVAVAAAAPHNMMPLSLATIQ